MKTLLFALAAGAAVAAHAQQAKALAEKLNWANPADGHKVVVELEKGGEPFVKELIAMLKEANDADCVKASFALEALVQHVSRPGADAERTRYAKALAGLVDGAADDVAKGIVVKLLQQCGGDAEIPAIVKQLPNDRVRDYAIMALTAIGTPAAKAALADAAAKADTAVAHDYVSAIGKLRIAEAVPVLMKLFEAATPYQRVAVMDALGEIGCAEAADKILAVLQQSKGHEQAGARGALAKLTARMADREAAKALAQKYYAAEPGEASLAVLLDAQGLDATLDALVNEVVKGDFVRRDAMLKLLQAQESDKVVPALVAAAKGDVAADVRADIVAMLGRRGEAAGRDYVVACMKDASAEVRKAAFEALPKFGVTEAVPLLAEVLATGSDEDIPAVKAALAWQQCEGFDDVIAAAVPRAGKAGKLALLRLLAERRAVAKSDVVYAALTDEPAVRKEALKALEVLAKPADLPKLLDFILKAETAADRRGAQSVLTLLGRSDEALVRQLVDVVGKAQGGSRITLQQVLAAIGGADALACVTADLQHGDAAVKDGAVRALADWRDASAAPALTQLATQKDNTVHRVLALRGLIRVSAMANGKTPAQCVEDLKRAYALCLTNDERKLVLGAVGGIRIDQALSDIIIPAFEEAELVPEASSAAVKIVCSQNRNDRGLTSLAARKAMELVIAKCGNEALLSRAKAHMGAFPPAGVDIAFSKPVKTSCPQQGDKKPQNAVDGNCDISSAWYGNQWPSWFCVDLEEEQNIDSIRPIFYWDGRRSYAYTVDVSSDNANWKTVVDNSKNTLPATADGINHVLTPSVKARYVRLNILKNSVNEAVHLVEFEVYSLTAKQPKAAGPNLLLRQPVTAGSEQEQHYAPTRVNDGRIGKLDGWHTDKCPTWIKVDMQQLAEIDTARVIFYWDGTRTYSYNIEVSEDDQTWKRVADNSNNQIPVDAQGIVHRFPSVKARYVKLNVTRGVGGRYVHVVELEAYATGKAPAVFPAAEKPVVKVPPLPPADADGFINLFNGKDFTGWMGAVNGYGIKDGGIMYCDPKKGGKLLTQWQFADFELHFDFLLSKGANNGLGIRTPADGDPAYVGMELQIIDNDGYKAGGHALQPWQHHGSIYGVVPAKDGALKPAGEWNHEEVIAKGSQIMVKVNGKVIVDADISGIEKTADGKGRAKHPGLDRRTGHIGWLGHGDLVEFKNIRIKVLEPYTEGPHNVPPEGFTALFNGKDLIGWKGLVGNPESRAKMTPAQLAEKQAAADTKMRAHWKVENGVICFDGKGDALCTAKDYGNFEMYVDWKMTKRGDSGIYLRGTPQVQIWDPEQWKIGSGGLYNNQKNPSKPTMIMDNPVGQWNRFRIRMVGDRVSVWLNGALVVDNVIMENYWDRRKPIYPTGQIELQNHNSPLWFRNIYIKELD